MNPFTIYLFIVGIINLIFGYMRRFREKGLIIWPKVIAGKEKDFFKLRGNFDILYGMIMVFLGLYSHLFRPDIFILLLMVISIIIISHMVLHSLSKKNKIY
ncbi:hypothetical protein [Tissierella sp. Yu-01]|uniref:hypothetical protein n=1 Tax=Tissierella sp. Yu-01 TaxID=3035694 RepID=UPI00240CF227|nr:hypothetical protein [Tissierella sp. Yu-01]WFA09057.1 hypothetical protein P3962_00375 [Tissierella sp. Yu-01]